MNQTAVFGGGCFWCLEAVFQRVQGVEKVMSGYAGGHLPDPTDTQVYGGRTGHAEVVEIQFNPDVISYKILLDIFFTIHDPTTLNRQGNDVGEEYRSVVFYMSDEQKQQAEQCIQELTDKREYHDPIVTQVEPLDKFYSAAEYHQNFYNVNPQSPYCQLIISPKIKKFEKKFADRLKLN